MVLNTRAFVDVAMIIDDNNVDLYINERVLQYDKFSNNIISCSSGGDALTQLQSLELQQFPDVIFLDINMPVIDGFKFLFEFSKFSQDKQNKCRIVVVSSSDDERDKEKASAHPSYLDFISKPLDEDKIIAIRHSLESIN